ncbi:MAG: DUF4412 domain-containing protein [Nitrospiraceae bacterium]|nr:MAG: DUF4412 domain-containing protein [Nitrospiraceae bacterium]
MKRRKEILFTLIITILFGMTAWAVEKTYQEPKVEYSADEYMETEGSTMKSKIFRSPQKERREQVMEGMKQVMISRMDKKVIWILMPDQKMYMEMMMQEGKAKEETVDLRDYKIEQSVIGQEVVNGINTTKSKVTMTDPKRTRFEGFMWNTKDGIMVKMDTSAKAEGTKMRMKTELKNLKIEKQDPKLFEVPAGYKKMSMPAMPGMGGGY